MERPQWRDDELVVMREKDDEEYEIDPEGTCSLMQNYRDTLNISAFGCPERRCYWRSQGKACRRNYPRSGRRVYVPIRALYIGERQLVNCSMSIPWMRSIGRSCLRSAADS